MKVMRWELSEVESLEYFMPNLKYIADRQEHYHIKSKILFNVDRTMKTKFKSLNYLVCWP